MTQADPNSNQNEGQPYLKIERLNKKFGEFVALQNISLDVYEGEFVCFLGPSGCGKTTLLRCIAGLDIQTSGRVVQAGADVSTSPPAMRDFGIVFQSYALFPNLTVHQNLAYGLENRHMAKETVVKRVEELLDLVGLAGQNVKYPAQLSGGQQQRVALARALATWPGLLLLDEPLSALDAKVRVYLRHEVKELQRRLGVTTIMVTHDQEEALTMADRVVVMDQGTISQVGTPVEVYRDPKTRFVADFVGTMNFLPGVMLAPQRCQVGEIELDFSRTVGEPQQGDEITVCIRPEDLAIQDSAGDTGNTAIAQVEEVEFLGAFYRVTLISGKLGGRPVTADLSPKHIIEKEIRVSALLTIVFPADRIHVFPAH